MVSDIIKVTSLKAGMLVEDLSLLDRYASMIPADWLALLQALGAGTLSGHLSFFEPRHFNKSCWPFDFQKDDLSKLQTPGEQIQLPWVGQGMLTLGKCDRGWVTTGSPGTRELRLHPSARSYQNAETFASLDHLLTQFNPLPSRHVEYPHKAQFESILDRRAAGSGCSCDASLLVPKIQSLVPDEVFVSQYSLCFHFRAYEALVELGNFMLRENPGVQLSAIFNPSKVDSSVAFFNELNLLLRS